MRQMKEVKMKRDSTPLWGLLLIGIGAVVALRSMGIFIGLNLWFWISLVIIIPCFIRMFTSRGSKWGQLMGIFFGVFLMLHSLGILSMGMLIPLFIAAIFVFSGLKMLVKGDQKEEWNGHKNKDGYTTYQNPNASQNKENYWQQGEVSQQTNYQNVNMTQDTTSYQGSGTTGFTFGGGQSTNTSSDFNSSDFKKETSQRGNSSTFGGNTREHGGAGSNGDQNGYCAYTAVFSGREIDFNNELFQGVMLSAVFGSIELNLRNAMITRDVTIDVKTVFGGVELYVPRDAKVIVNCSPVLGSVENNTISPIGMVNCPTIYVNATCVLGGIEVKY